MTNINNQQLNLMALLQGSGVKQNGLTNAGLSVGQNGSAEEFLNLLQSAEGNSENVSKQALLEALKGNNVDTNVADSLDKLKSQQELEKLLTKEAVKDFIAANPELAPREMDPELKSLLTEMKKTEKSMSQELDILTGTGLPVKTEENLEKGNIAGKNSFFPGKVALQKRFSNNQLQIQNTLMNAENKNQNIKVGENQGEVSTDPRIPFNIIPKNKKQDKTILSSGNDFVKNMNSVGKNLSGLGNNHEQKVGLQSRVNGYGKVQNSIRNSLIDLSGADFNTNAKVENEFGSSLQVEGVSQNGNNSSMEFLAANLKTEAPKGFDVINNNTKVLDLSSINTNNQIELIDKISAHIEQSKIEGSDKLDLLVKHEDLGNFRVNVAKVGKNQVDLEIVTQNQKGKEFFVQNEANMIKSLDQSGVKLSNFRLVTGTSHSEFSSFSSDSKGQGSDFNQSFSSNQQSHSRDSQGGNRDSERRRELWEQYKEQTDSRQSA